MEISYNRKINFSKYNWKSYVSRHINITITHKNLILLKQEFRHVAFSQLTQGRNKAQRLEMFAQCTVKGWYLMKIFDPHCVACIAVSSNNSVSSAYRNAFAEKANEAESSAILHQKTKSILSQNSSFSKMEQVESHTGESLGQPRSNVFQLMN